MEREVEEERHGKYHVLKVTAGEAQKVRTLKQNWIRLLKVLKNRPGCYMNELEGQEGRLEEELGVHCGCSGKMRQW